MGLEFKSIPAVFPEQLIYGANTDSHSYVITHELDIEKFVASVRVHGASAFSGAVSWLGKFDDFDSAKAACEEFLQTLRS